MAAAWYLTKAGRDDFGKRCRERDHEWWRDATLWVGLEDEHGDPVMVEAINTILRQCPGWVDVIETYSREKLERRADYRWVVSEARRILDAHPRRKETKMQNDLQLTRAL